MVIDRFEEEYAVIENDDGSMINIQKSLLPPEAKEGSMLRFENGVYMLDPSGEEERRRRIIEKTHRIFGKL